MICNIEPLLFVPSPRDLTEFYEEFNKIQNFDKYLVRYTKPENSVYDIGRTVFLKNKQYTHFVICPDDLIIKQEHIDRLYQDLCFLEIQREGQSQKVCIGGYCNIDVTTKSDLANISFDKVKPNRANRVYNFPTLQELRDMRHSLPYSASPYPFVDVMFSGFPLFAIPRSILERIEFRDDLGGGVGCCLDVMWCYDMYMNSYRILCDLDLELYHMKVNDHHVVNFMAGTKEPISYFEFKTR